MELTYKLWRHKIETAGVLQVQVHGAQTVKNIDISHIKMFTLPVVFAVIP